MRKIRMNVTVWQDRNFPFVSIIDHNGLKRNVNGWKISEISKTGKSIEVYVYDGNIITATVNRRLKFNDDKTMMTITPALTSVDDEEQWFHLD